MLSPYELVLTLILLVSQIHLFINAVKCLISNKVIPMKKKIFALNTVKVVLLKLIVNFNSQDRRIAFG